MGVGSYMRPLFPRVEQREHRLRAAAFRPQPTIYANLSGNWDGNWDGDFSGTLPYEPRPLVSSLEIRYLPRFRGLLN